ncbi:PREDICTED: osteoclast-stimulating factor 1-like [Ceratosolen solmsi marchali]|uniref:Osteoclast-stimulating factor 1 n=1 Tax=Ceratosolen solmsi marchali TaxID=326594 RepID=A0AAJ6YTV1_9HYME|nr:PREDICTED: osteoclast-stimulating factor 1-like [Ceratosolen solmsi marchali]
MAATLNTPGRPAPPKPVSKPGKVKVVRALYKYVAQHSDELSFEEGDLLYVYDNGQSKVSNRLQAQCGNRKGWIPANYVEEQVEEIILPLHEAARRGNISFLRECLNSGVSGTGLDSAGNTPLYWAARAGHEDCVKLLLDLPNPAVNAQNKMGDSPLHVAASHGHLNIVNRLLEAGNDATLKNNTGYTAQELASDPVIKNVIQLSQQHYNAKTIHDYNEEDYNDESD